jgi:uncharacterized protein YukE
MIGMNIEAVQALAREMRRTAGEIDSVVGQLNGKLLETKWEGPDQVKFTQEWQSVSVTSLGKVARELEKTADHLDREANQQAQASGVQ